MQSLTYQHNTGLHPGAMINRAQAKAAPDHEKIRDAVRAWSSALDNQDVVSALIINEYREQGGTAISFPEDISRARQKLFRFLDNRFDSEQYRENVRQLSPRCDRLSQTRLHQWHPAWRSWEQEPILPAAASRITLSR
ncbi:regulatory protein CII [Enterobacter hormaechei]|nr:regulatory protein CII [Enterobacter hormaechei]